MKIAIIAHNLYPIKEPFEGGLEMVTYLLCSSLMRLGHQVDLYAHRDSDTKFRLIPILSCERRLVAIRKRTSDSFEISDEDDQIISYTRVMSLVADGNYDIVHNHSLHFIPILIGNCLDVPVITSFHTPQFNYLKLGARSVANNQRQIFTMVSKSLADTWSDIIPRAHVIYNGIDLNKWNFVERPSGDYLFWYGRICPEKGTHLAIEAALKSSHKIVLAGPVSNRDYYEEEIAPMLQSPSVLYEGHLSQCQIAPLLQNARGMLFTSTWEEPYGLTIAESLACGTPVVAYEGGATQEILTPKCGIVVPKNSIYKLVKAIHAIKRLHRKDCRQRAELFCSHHLMVRNYVALYDSLLEHEDDQIRRIS